MIRKLINCVLLHFALNYAQVSASAIRMTASSLCLKSNSPTSIYRTISTTSRSADESEGMALLSGIIAAITVSSGMLSVVASDNEHLIIEETGNFVKKPARTCSECLRKNPRKLARARLRNVQSFDKSPVAIPKLGIKSKDHLVSQKMLKSNAKLLASGKLIGRFDTSCKNERRMDLEEIEAIQRFTVFNLEDTLNLRLMTEVYEGSAAMLLAIRHGLFLKAYGLICKNYCPHVIFTNGESLDASDFIAEIIIAALKQGTSNWEKEQITIVDLISNIYKAAGSNPKLLLKAKAIAIEAQNTEMLRHLNELGSFVSRLYPVKPPEPAQICNLSRERQIK